MSAFLFTDNSGVTRDVRVTFRTIFNVADRTGFDLLNPGEEQQGVVLSEELLTKPTLVVKIVAALCEVKDEELDAFYEAVDGKVFAALEDSFWKAYTNFFVQCGRDWLALAIQKSLERRESRYETARETLLLDSPSNDSFSSSSQPESTTGSTELSGNSQDAPKPDSKKNRATERKSSAQSTTRTQKPIKNSEPQGTSISTKEPKANPKRKNS